MRMQSRLMLRLLYQNQRKKTDPLCLRYCLIQHFSTKSDNPKYDLAYLEDEKRRNSEAKIWLENSSPEMKIKKIRIESEVQILQESGFCFDYKITPADWKIILQHYPNKTKYMKYLYSQQRKKDRREEKKVQMEKMSTVVGDTAVINPDVKSVFAYTKPHSLAEERLKKHLEMRTVFNSPVPVVIDMDYDLSLSEEKATVSDIFMALNINRYHTEPCAIHLTSYLKNSDMLERRTILALNKVNTVTHENRFHEIFPRKKLVYLTPDAPALQYHTPGDIYVIGGMVEHRGFCSPFSLRKARKLNIRCGSIPFAKYRINKGSLHHNQGYNMNISKTLEFVLNINLKHRWEIVMNDFKNTLLENRGRLSEKISGFI